jgi:WD40 repeat protein
MKEIDEKEKHSKINYIGFNHDSTYFTVGTDIGFQLYHVAKTINLLLSRNLNGSIGLVKILDKSNIFGLVGAGQNPLFSPNKLMIWNDSKNSIVNEYRCPSFILNCFLKQNCIFIICADNIFLVSTKSMKLIQNIKTINNPRGIGTVSNDTKKYILAFPDLRKGMIQIMFFKQFETDNNNILEIIDNKDNYSLKAHDGSIHLISLNYDGTKLASASDRGTVIRVFDLKTKDKIAELRRGTTDADIFCLSFSFDSSLIALTSDHSTCHIFSLTEYLSKQKKEQENVGKSSIFGYISSGFSYLGVNKAVNTIFKQISTWKMFDISHKKKIFAGFLKDDNRNVYVLDEVGKCYIVDLIGNKDPKITFNTQII